VRILFVNSHAFYSEPLGTMQLSAICKAAGHETKLAIITRHSLFDILEQFSPDVIGYSAMTPNEHLFIMADEIVQEYAKNIGKPVTRIMGGPHPTYFPEVINKMNLDAIVAGDGDNAITNIIARLEAGQDLNNIPNVITRDSENFEFEKEVIEDLNELPHLDRADFYEAVPDLQHVGIRGFMTQRGCPYKCTYCFNHAFNKMFKGGGRKLIRRRSVDDIIAEVKHVRDNFGPLRYVRFADDVFVIRKDDWLVEFAEKFPKEVGLPFYCLIRATALTDEVAELLAKAGCRSASMSIEAGNAELRNRVLKRNMSDDQLIQNFAIAHKHGIATHSNAMMGIPGTTLEDDWNTFLFARKVGPTAPTFGIYCPYPKAELSEYAKEIGVLPDDFDYNQTYRNESVMTNYTDKERAQQVRLSYLATFFCFMPDFMLPVMKFLIKLPLTRFYSLVEATTETYLRGLKVFPGAQPRNPLLFIKSGWSSLMYIFKNAMPKSDKEKVVESIGFRNP
jgi:anaerobic magnesium-protoporphyrin IX monomethyl ester cyclase